MGNLNEERAILTKNKCGEDNLIYKAVNGLLEDGIIPYEYSFYPERPKLLNIRSPHSRYANLDLTFYDDGTMLFDLSGCGFRLGTLSIKPIEDGGLIIEMKNALDGWSSSAKISKDGVARCSDADGASFTEWDLEGNYHEWVR